MANKLVFRNSWNYLNIGELLIDVDWFDRNHKLIVDIRIHVVTPTRRTQFYGGYRQFGEKVNVSR